MKNICCGIAVAALVMGGVSTLRADSVADKIGISGFAGASFPMGDDSVMDHTGDVGHDFGGMLRVGVTPKMSIGASYNNINLFGKDGERHHPETILANVLIHLRPEKKLVPTLQLGAGMGSSLTDGSFDKFASRVGLGLDYFLCPTLSVGPQVNYTYIDNSDAVDEYHAVAAGLQVSLFFGKPKDSAPEAATSTLAPMIAPVPVAAVTPAQALEQPIEQKVSINLKVLFDTGKSVVKPAYRSEIAQVAEFMDLYGKSSAEIEGHSDNVGSAELNKRLSQARADAVRDYLIKEFHVDASRITAVGYGEERPMADNSTKEGQEKNRRVVAILQATKLVHPNR